jgi:hypothetical protein
MGGCGYVGMRPAKPIVMKPAFHSNHALALVFSDPIEFGHDGGDPVCPFPLLRISRNLIEKSE